MLKVLAGFILCIALTSPIQASPTVFTFGKNSDVVFPHKQHQNVYGKCTECHGAKEPGRIAQFGEEWAHDTCSGCHGETGAGPVECSGCHSQM